MEFGSFDDDLFDGEQKDVSQSKLSCQSESYVPKFEHPCWFLADFSSDSNSTRKDDDFLEKGRMRANYFYLRRDHEKAAQLYGRLLQDTVSSFLQNEFTESYARSLMGCDRFDEAERVSIEFYRGASNYDRQLQALNLLSDLYWRQDSYRRCAVVSGCLASLMEGGNADLWYRLGHCFIRWDALDSVYRNGDLIDSQRLSDVGSDFAQLAPSWFQKCLVRAYALYWATYASSVGYAKERNEKMRQRIEVDLKTIYGDDELVDTACYRKIPEKEGKMENGESEQDDNDDQQSAGQQGLHKMLDDDLLSVFQAFVRKWLA